MKKNWARIKRLTCFLSRGTLATGARLHFRIVMDNYVSGFRKNLLF